ncbi:MAG: DUF3035 domain-containing protein [Alphaproteobacteria bacterium]|nr:DUF3035 domain-containing protein [Alphaproteobacteria bacterium]
MKMYFRLMTVALVLLSLNSCDSGLKKSLGITHNSPDEYSVLKNAPLSVPPNFELTPPSDNVIKKHEPKQENINFSERSNAKAPQKKSTNISKADKSFMKKFDAHEKRKDIREIIEKDSKPSNSSGAIKEEKKSGGMFSKIKGWF